MNVLLSGIVGSSAYGLAHAGSDVDRLGIFATPTKELLGLHTPPDYHGHKDDTGDVALHEVGKFVRLALKGNPTIMELLWLPAVFYEQRSGLGDELIALRASFLSAKRVRDAYFGYASQQFIRLRNRNGHSFSADTVGRTAKHARHMYRLLHQGYELWSTGNLTIRVEDPTACREFGERIESGEVDLAEAKLASMEMYFNDTLCVLPDEPDEPAIEDWVQRVRKYYYI